MLSLRTVVRRVVSPRAMWNCYSKVAEPIAATAEVDKLTFKRLKTLPKAISKRALIAEAFNTMKEETPLATLPSKPIDEAIANATTLAELLAIAERSTIQRNQALGIVSILYNWAQSNRIQMSEFETDSRFLALCRMLGRNVHQEQHQEVRQQFPVNAYRAEDLNLVMSVASDDEAAKLVSTISLPQMVTVMVALSQKKRRTTPLLRSLAQNISNSKATLDLKQCADLMYSMASLNFWDTVLVTRICSDILSGVQKNERPAVIGSIITSLGLMRHRDTDLIDALTEWMIKHRTISRPEDFLSLFQTLATVNYPTVHIEQLKEKLLPVLLPEKFSKSKHWLNYVWALTVLDMAKQDHIDSVLSSVFTERLVIENGDDLNTITKRKLLQVNAAAQYLIPNYTGSKLAENSSAFDVSIQHTKNKAVLVTALDDALKGLISSDTYLRKCGNTGMGFIIDVECIFNSEMQPLPVDGDHKDAVRCALLVQDFHDLCTGGHNQPTGFNALSIRLLEQSGYKVLVFPHFEFSNRDNVLQRVKYLEAKLKSVVKIEN